MISLFAFLLILGIVVDDAIIVGEPYTRDRPMATWATTVRSRAPTWSSSR